MCKQIPARHGAQQRWSQKPEGKANPRVPRRMAGSTKCGLSRRWNTSLKQEGHSDACCSADDGEGITLSEINRPQKDSTVRFP